MRSTERSRGSWRGNIHVGTCSHVLNARQNCIFQDSTRMITATLAIYINVKHRKPPAFLSLNFYFKLHGPMKLNYDFIALRRTLPEPFLGRLPPDPFLAIRPRTEKYEKRKIYIYITRIFFFFLYGYVCIESVCSEPVSISLARTRIRTALFSLALCRCIRLSLLSLAVTTYNANLPISSLRLSLLGLPLLLASLLCFTTCDRDPYRAEQEEERRGEEDIQVERPGPRRDR